MSLTALAPAAIGRGVSSLDAVSEQVRSVLLRAVAPRWRPERRTEERHPYPYPVYITPLDRAGRPDVSQTVTGLGKHLSDHGLDFYSFQPLAFKRAVVSLELGDGQLAGLVLDLKWCRFTSHGWYENGGRFIETIRSPLAAAPSLAAVS